MGKKVFVVAGGVKKGMIRWVKATTNEVNGGSLIPVLIKWEATEWLPPQIQGLPVNLMSRGFRGISSQPAQPSVAVFHDPLDNGSAPLCYFFDFRGGGYHKGRKWGWC